MATKLKNAIMKFSDFWKKPVDKDLSKQPITVLPAPRKAHEPAANEKLLKGIYTGSAQDFALSSYIAKGMVDATRNLTGIPGIIPDEGQSDMLIRELLPLLIDEFPVLLGTMLITGTSWRWARWSDKLHKLTWEAIPDSSITSIIQDLDTGEITDIYTDEQIEYREGEINIKYTHRKRHITRAKVTEEWKGGFNKTLQYRNPFGFMPVPFGHNCYEGEWRGNSVFGRVLRLLKASHDIAYKRDEILAEFEPKIIQNVKDIKTWISNNTKEIGNTDSVFDPFGHKLFINQEGENTDFLSLPSDATAQHTVALKDIEGKIVKGSGMPELFFGAIATGNYASTETDRLLALEHIKGIRREITKGTQDIIDQSLKILAYMRFTQPPQVSIQWGNITLLSEIQKAQVMGAYAQTIVPMLRDGAISPEGAFYFTKELFPEYPAEDPKHFMSGLSEMLAQHSGRVGQPTFDMGGMF